MPATTQDLPVVVIGAGPIGLAAAAHLRGRDLPAVVLEAGDEPAANVRGWGHVRLFSTWDQLVDDAAAKLLAPTGWTSPSSCAYPTGAEWFADYLQPLAEVLGDTVRTGHRVTAISRQGADVMSDSGRDDRPFVLYVDTPDGPQRLLASAVIDASGTVSTPNPLGADGLPVPGEAANADRIAAGVPDLGDAAVRAQHAGAHTAVVGAGHTAMNALVALAKVADEAPGTRISWVIRRASAAATYGGGTDDQLAARGALGMAAKALVDDGTVEVVTGFRIVTVDTADDRLVLRGEDGRTVDGIDRVVTATGYRPDLSLTSELRVDLHPSVQAPRELAPLIDPNVHSCGSVPPHGEAELAHPESGFYMVGMKSYGRAPTFLAMTGFEQVRSVVAMLAGDEAAAREVQLVLPETGVCGGTGLADDEVADLPTGVSELPGGLPLTATTQGGCC